MMANFIVYFLKLAVAFWAIYSPNCVNGQDGTNVALQSSEAKCDAFPYHDSDNTQNRACTGAIDGVQSQSTPHRWAFLGNPLNSWIQVEFSQDYDISLAKIMPLQADIRTFKDVKLEFDLGALSDPFVGTNEISASLNNVTEGYIWEEIPVSPPVRARRARLTVLSSRVTTDLFKAYNGLIELQYWVLSPTTAPPPTTSATSTTTTTTPDSTTSTTVEQGSFTGQDGTDLVPIIGGVVGAAVLIIIIVAVVICCRHKRKNEIPKDESNIEDQMTILPSPEPEVKENGIRNSGLVPDVVPVPAPVVQPDYQVEVPLRKMEMDTPSKFESEITEPDYDNIGDRASVVVNIESEPIKVQDLSAYVIEVQNGEKGFAPEFKRLPKGAVMGSSIGRMPSFQKKNRFRNIIPYDNTRVKLKELRGKKNSTYVNANYIEGYKTRWQYIAAQGPMPETVDDFWRMVWEQDSPKIVMVTNLMEGGRLKCEEYWPKSSQKCGDIKVTNRKERMKETPDYTLKVFELEKGSSKKTIGHFHYTTWPDEGVPDAATSLLAFMDFFMHNKIGSGKGPIVIHCSAGVGRTGTLIAIQRLIEQALEEGEVDVLKCVSAMRLDRMSMVQSVDQYEFIYLALVESLLCADIRIPCDKLNDRFPALLSHIKGADVNMIEQQFQVLDVFRINVPDILYETARCEENSEKNRDENVLPGEYNRPYLSPLQTIKETYINAVFVRGYRKRDAFIATQMPLKTTQVDLWRTARDFKCTVIIMLNPLDSYEVSDCEEYWPEGEETTTIGPFILTNESTFTTTTIKTTDINVEFQEKDKESFDVRHLRLLDWAEGSAFPENKSSLIALYRQVMAHRKPDDQAPIIVHCIYGDDRSGLLCAMFAMFEAIDAEQEVDVFNPVRRSRRGRPQFIPTVEQYRYLYELAQEYIHSPGSDEASVISDESSEDKRHKIVIEMDD